MTPLLSTCTLGNDCYDPISLSLSLQPKPPKGLAPPQVDSTVCIH